MISRKEEFMISRKPDFMNSGFLIDGHDLMFLEEFREGKFNNLIIF